LKKGAGEDEEEVLGVNQEVRNKMKNRPIDLTIVLFFSTS
jgi:hypothetical protein